MSMESRNPMKLHFVSLGCPKNQVDSELMQGMLHGAGYQQAPREEAEILVVNTCAFINQAKEESIQTIFELAQLKAEGRARSLVVTGCLPQRYGKELQAELPEVDAFLGTGELGRIVDICQRLSSEGGSAPLPRSLFKTDPSLRSGLRGLPFPGPSEGAQNGRDWVSQAPPGYLYDADAPRLLGSGLPYAYVKIAEGCDRGCTFCVIPQIRGRHRSRPWRTIDDEVEALARQGIQEAILVSQDTLAYGRDLDGNGDFGDLLLRLGETAMPWIRFLYIHPVHVTPTFIDKLSRARVLPYLDLPIQHADDGILRAMRRNISRKRMAEVIVALRQALPGCTLRTSVMVGFPGEGEAEFESLLEFMEEVRFDRLGVFTYSREEGSPAMGMGNQVPADLMEERARLVQETQARISWERSQKLIGTTQEVLVDGPSEDPAFPWEGRTAAQAPEIDGVVYLRSRRLTPGHRVTVRITEAEGDDLIAQVETLTLLKGVGHP